MATRSLDLGSILIRVLKKVRSLAGNASLNRLLTASIAPQYYKGIPGTARAADRRFKRQSRPFGRVTSDLSFDDSNSGLRPCFLAGMPRRTWNDRSPNSRWLCPPEFDSLDQLGEGDLDRLIFDF